MFAETFPSRQVRATGDGGHTAYRPLVTTFVALGDSLTEGVGDPHPSWPNGLRGWADLVASRLAVHDPATEYANLALRGRTARDVAAEQLPPALRMRPDVVTVWAGGNDVLRPVLRLDDVLAPVDHTLASLIATGATVVVFTGFEVTGSPAFGPVRSRVRRLNAGLREIAQDRGALVADVSDRAEWSDRRLWADDRVHPSVLGHARLAAQVLRLLGLEGVAPPVLGAGPRANRGRVVVDEVRWWRHHAVPHIARWASGASRRELVLPKWSVPVRPSGARPWFEGGNDLAATSAQPLRSPG
ncbi:SGNH/GDSL hydrolase family protein [Knoellia locipacati]|uniref:SGNH hydrolase n=1 Tax=Knoellia locipacati TaxID=882824 RepID=A0A512SY50_9MICO|nr:SGNH/GDSL hydrolase family protein [Knoellia locipacati]GEQ12887.1 SGNH hydrolase [Knoellia locipacati]